MLVGLAALGATTPTTALAQGSLNLSVSPDPVAGLPIKYSATGTDPGPDAYGSDSYELWLHVRTADEGPCAADSFSDPPQRNDQAFATGNEETVTGGGNFAYSWTIPSNLRGRGIDTTTMPPGRYLVCAWLDDPQASGPPVAAATLPFSVRAPRMSVALSPPADAHLHQRRAFSARGSAEVPAHLTVDLLPECVHLRKTRSGIGCAGGYVHSCARTPEAEDNYFVDFFQVHLITLLSKELPAGRFTRTPKVTFGRGWIPGRHTVCAWMGMTSSDGNPDEDVYIARTSSFVLKR